MKKGIKSILLILFGLCTGYLIYHFKSPSINASESFWIGVLSCICIGFILISIQLRMLKPRSKRFLLATYFVGFLFIGATIATIYVYQLNTQYAEKNLILEENIQIQERIANSSIEINKIELVGILLKEIGDEVKLSEKRSLSPNTLKRIIQLSNSLYPFYLYDQDTLSNKKLSPGRGQLMLGLSYLNLDSSDFAYLIQRANFSYSLLKDVDLSGLNLNGINLDHADLSFSDLNGCNLRNASFYTSKLYGVNLTNSNLDSAYLKMANLNRTNFINSSMNYICLDGTSLIGSNLSNTTLVEASMDWVELSNAVIENANMERVDLRWATINGTRITNSNLTDSRLIHAKISNCSFKNSNLNGTAVEENWFKLLNDKNIFGYEVLKSDYLIEERKSDLYWNLSYFLKSTKN